MIERKVGMKMSKNLQKKGTVALDSNFLIYHIEGDESISSRTEELLNTWYGNGVQILMSVIAVTECFVDPFQRNDLHTCKLYEDFFNHVENLSLVDMTKDIAMTAAKLRADYGIRTPDGLHLATAINSGADIFVTNDKRLKKVSEIKVVDIQEL
ncbi:PIN domain-containing protein [Candidatus Dojkabacteria bacterium]|nr:PIN domain-containing protein [Candidatus Dojkabacteria bacterium]